MVSIAWDDYQDMHLWRNNASSTIRLPSVALPTIHPNGGVFSNPVSVTLAMTTSDAEIRYTLDGSNPSPSSTLYTAAFFISETSTLQAKAFKSDFDPSPIAGASFIIGVEPPAGLAGHWPFEEGVGTTSLDVSGQGHQATLQGASWENDGKIGKAVSLDGQGDYIDVGPIDVSGNVLTLAAWFNSADLANCGNSRDCRIISKATGTAEQDHYWMISTIADGTCLITYGHSGQVFVSHIEWWQYFNDIKKIHLLMEKSFI